VTRWTALSLHSTPRLRFLNCGEPATGGKFQEKISSLLAYYGRLLIYAAGSKAKILHILWNNKFELSIELF